MLPPVRRATNTLRDDARAITRNQLELALGAVNYFERELLIDPLEVPERQIAAVLELILSRDVESRTVVVDDVLPAGQESIEALVANRSTGDRKFVRTGPSWHLLV